MDIQSEKKQIVEELQNRNEEWLIIAIKKLLDLDDADEFSNEHKVIIEERIKQYESDPENVITLEQLREDLQKEGRL